MNHPLSAWGWNDDVASRFAPHGGRGHAPGRVVTVHQDLFRVATAHGERLATVTGKFQYEAASGAAFPAVGDWVALTAAESGRAVIHAVLPRSSQFSRRAAGGPTAEQVVAANVTSVFLVMALNRDFNPRRLERYLTLAYESGARPVTVLTKADLCEHAPERVAEARAVALGAPVHALSALEGTGLDALSPYLGPGETVALLGSSGAGKSTLLNRLAGAARLRTQSVREGDDRGRHTTTHRELVPLETGATLMDTPGMRELQLWESDTGLDDAFADVEALAAACRYRDCRHAAEPGCAVKGAIAEGTLDAGRYGSYVKLERELAHLARKTDKAAALAEKARWKQIHQAYKQRDTGR